MKNKIYHPNKTTVVCAPCACRTGALSKAGIVMILAFVVIHLYGVSS